jgi:hypothetical protein
MTTLNDFLHNHIDYKTMEYLPRDHVESMVKELCSDFECKLDKVLSLLQSHQFNSAFEEVKRLKEGEPNANL